MNSLKDIKWYETVKFKMISSLILTMTVVLIIAGLFAYNYIKDYETEKLTEFASVAADRLSKSLVTPMWNIDREQVDDLLNTEMAQRLMVGIVVLDEASTEVFAAKGRDSAGRVIDFKGTFGKEHIHVSRNIVKDKKNIGTLDVYITDDYLKEALVQFALGEIGVVFVLALAIFLIMSLLLSSIVIKPLLGLVDSANAISRGELNQAFGESSKDEIGYLAEAFKKMQTSLKIAMGRLSDSKNAAPAKKSTISPQNLQEFSQKIQSTGRIPPLTSIFKYAAECKTVPDDLVFAAWKEWNQLNK